ncbi:hypothetical protein CH381_26900 [Leptospira sp. mixed culture ATI2-C-A1]|nr:hypothetical protein CH381_26900 [Leptospira sp. mixed culture ATI2-C-A1]
MVINTLTKITYAKGIRRAWSAKWQTGANANPKVARSQNKRQIYRQTGTIFFQNQFWDSSR